MFRVVLVGMATSAIAALAPYAGVSVSGIRGAPFRKSLDPGIVPTVTKRGKHISMFFFKGHFLDFGILRFHRPDLPVVRCPNGFVTFKYIRNDV